MEWQPIETAPKDGKCLLWVDTDDGGEFAVLARDKNGHWIHEGEPTFCHGFYYAPALWMPLPDPPKEQL
jgi:hypothetical protein